MGSLVARPSISAILTCEFLVLSLYFSDGTTDSVICRISINYVAD